MIFKECYDTDDLTVEIYTPEAPRFIIYFFSPTEELDMPYDFLDENSIACVNLMNMDWNKDLTPWKAPIVLGKDGETEFGGGADEFLKKLYYEVIPQAEEILEDIADELPESFNGRRLVSGISLGGLFAIYAMYRTDLFIGASVISASMWYDDFLDFAKKYRIYKGVQKVCFLLGDKEKKARNARMAKVEDCTREMVELLRKQEVEASLLMVPGGHFADPAERVEKAFELLFS